MAFDKTLPVALLLLSYVAAFVPPPILQAPRVAALGARRKANEEVSEEEMYQKETQWLRDNFDEAIPTADASPEASAEAMLDVDPADDDLADGTYLRGPALGMDDPLDAAWRKDAEATIRSTIEAKYADCGEVDILWGFNHLQVTVSAAEGKEDTLGSAVIEMLNFEITEALLPTDETAALDSVLARHALTVCTPGAKDVLTTQKEFDVFKGFEVHVRMRGLPATGNFPGAEGKTVVGKLQGRTADEVLVNQKGRIVKLPNNMVLEVRLPQPETEEGDLWTGEPVFGGDVWETEE